MPFRRPPTPPAPDPSRPHAGNLTKLVFDAHWDEAARASTLRRLGDLGALRSLDLCIVHFPRGFVEHQLGAVLERVPHLTSLRLDLNRVSAEEGYVVDFPQCLSHLSALASLTVESRGQVLFRPVFPQLPGSVQTLAIYGCSDMSAGNVLDTPLCLRLESLTLHGLNGVPQFSRWTLAQSVRRLSVYGPAHAAAQVDNMLLQNASHVSTLTNLESLTLCRTQKMPAIGSLQSLTSLRLVDCFRFQSAPPQFRSLAKLSGLRQLVFDRCHMTSLPSSIASLTNLSELRATNCPTLRKVPQLSTLPSLKLLDLSCSGVTCTTFLAGTTSIERLNLNGCKYIFRVDLGPPTLAALRFLDARDCHANLLFPCRVVAWIQEKTGVPGYDIRVT